MKYNNNNPQAMKATLLETFLFILCYIYHNTFYKLFYIGLLLTTFTIILTFPTITLLGISKSITKLFSKEML